MRKVFSFVFTASVVVVACNQSQGVGRPPDAAPPSDDARASAPPSAVPVAGTVPVAMSPSPPPESGKCRAGMVEVKGDYCPDLKERCLEWMAADDRFRCKRFARSECRGATEKKHFCIDRYEYPNQQGQVPKVEVLWDEAQRLCANQGKRLCSAKEWTFACQGPDWLPYPYGSERDSDACRIDQGRKEPRWADAPALGYGRTAAPIKGQACVNFSKPSGSYPGCVSGFGVYDMTGNIDEWVSSDGSPGGASWLKGGWWGNLRNRCGTEATTTGHDKSYSGIQVGFRCCNEVSK